METFAEGAHAFANGLGDARGKAADGALQEVGDEVSLEPEGEGDGGERGGEDDEDDSGLGVLGEIKEQIDAEKNGDGADVKDAFDGPDGHLRSETEIGFAGDQVGTDEFAGTAEQGESGETDDLGGDEFAGVDV